MATRHGRGSSPRGYQTAILPKRTMEQIASVSRSSGIGQDGDTLKDFKVQKQYRTFLERKVDDVLTRYPRQTTESEKEARQRVESQENVLILFRKLREGISSSRRSDAFALEVYEMSLYLAAVFESPRQMTAIIPYLLSLYLNSPSPPHDNRTVTILISLLHYLMEGYPSQNVFRQNFDSIPASFLPQDCDAYRWITSIAKSLRVQNYTAFERLTQPSALPAISHHFDNISTALHSLSISSNDGQSLPEQALYRLVDSLRKKSRITAWRIIRSAYREFSCGTPEGTHDWLKRSLCLRSVIPYETDMEGEEWLEQQSVLGHTQRKEGTAGRWVVYKLR